MFKKSVMLFVGIFLISAVLKPALAKKKRSYIARKYHDITALYNGYFNANNLINKGQLQLATNHVDNFSEILPIYKLADEAKGKAITATMDEAIKKLSLVIQRHEPSKWIDNSYFKVGQAYFYKREYYTAAETFQYTTGKFKGTDGYYNSLLWLGLSYLQLNKNTEAIQVLDLATAEGGNLPSELREPLNAIYAQYYINSQNYNKAIDYLTRAADYGHNKDMKARYYYIIGQLQERVLVPDKAALAYARVVKYNPEYALAFNAQINGARLFGSKNSGSKKLIEKQLTKLLNEEKNKDFRDQIYYALGNIYEKDKNKTQALTFYQKSIQASTNNTTQKALSLLKLSEINFDENNYSASQKYYDSTAIFLPKTYPGYEEVIRRKDNLNELVKNINIIQYEDSLQKLAKLSDNERERFVRKAIEKEQEEANRIAEEKENALNNNATAVQNFDNNDGATADVSTANNWYFYNAGAVGGGNNDFLKKFGKRPLEDNWRRSLKQSNTDNAPVSDASSTAIYDAKNEKNPEERIKKLLALIPTSADALEKSNQRLAEAYYKLGIAYREKLQNNGLAVSTLEKGLSRVQPNAFAPQSYYNIYRIYLQMRLESKADVYKNKILTEHSQTVYAKLIQNPEASNKSKNAEAESFYEVIYNQYTRKDYATALSQATDGMAKYAGSSIGGRLALLQAFCIGKLQSADNYKAALSQVAKDFSTTEPGIKANQILELLNKPKASTVAQVQAPSLFKNLPDGEHIFVLAIPIGAKGDEIKVRLSKFNAEQFSGSNLVIKALLYGTDIQFITVQAFDDKVSAVKYYSTINQKVEGITKLEADDYKTFVIASENYVTLLKQKNMVEYITFFVSNYM